ncbi:hypothetical protein FB451DRAFT_1037404, partial [Mycena latifolia]
IKVGAEGLKITPSKISASIGDIVTFEFHPKKPHRTVTQSSFINPCKPLAQTSTTGQVGFKSGLSVVLFLQEIRHAHTTFALPSLTVVQTAPIWGYCGQQGPPMHCTEGMAFSINAVESGPNNFAAFQQIARLGLSGCNCRDCNG